ncbi:MAG: OmpA family protein [Chitinophagales bacterium]
MAWFNKSIGFFINVIFLVIAYWYVCEYNDNACSCFASSKPIEMWKIIDTEQTIFETKDRIKYQKHEVRPTLSEAIDSGLVKTVDYLSKNPNKELHIEASYLKKETIDTAIFSNLGDMRALHLAKYLEAKGLDKKQIVTKSELNTFDKVNENNLTGGVHLWIQDKRLLSLERERQLLNHALTVRFETAEVQILDSLALNMFADNVQKIFLQNKNINLLIVGYADQVGNELYNQKLSLKRAKTVKQFLINKNINTSKLRIKYKGEIDLPFNSDYLNRCVMLQLIDTRSKQ